MTGWLAIYLLHSTVLYTCALLLRRHFRSIAAAEAFWRSAALVPVASATACALWRPGLWSVTAPALVRPLDAAAIAGSTEHLPVTTGVLIITAIWGGTALVLMGRHLVARTLYLRSLGPRMMVDGRAADAFDRVCRRARISHIVRLTSSPALASPVAIGSAEICIPAYATERLADAELEALLSHELAHLLRRDTRWLLLMACLASLFFFQPLHRFARRELQRLAERACDRWAADQTGDSHAMATCLVKVAGWTRRTAPAGVVPMAAGPLTERVEHLLDGSRRSRPSRVPSLAWAGFVVAVVVLLPGVDTGQRGATAMRRVGAPEPPGAVWTEPPPRTPEYLAGLQAAQRFREEQRHAAVKQNVPARSSSSVKAPFPKPRPRRLSAPERAALERSLIALK